MSSHQIWIEKRLSPLVDVADFGGQPDEDVEIRHGSGAEVEEVGHLDSGKVAVVVVEPDAGPEGHGVALLAAEDGCHFLENGTLGNYKKKLSIDLFVPWVGLFKPAQLEHFPVCTNNPQFL